MTPRKIDWPNDRRPTREELYDRRGFRTMHMAVEEGQGVVFAVDPGADPITSEDVYRRAGDWP